MSWEGYMQLICYNKHYTTADCSYKNPETEPCKICKARIVWYNIVDLTNGSFDENGEQIDGFVKLKPIITQKCNSCNSTLSELYEIPLDKGHLIP